MIDKLIEARISNYETVVLELRILANGILKDNQFIRNILFDYDQRNILIDERNK